MFSCKVRINGGLLVGVRFENWRCNLANSGFEIRENQDLQTDLNLPNDFKGSRSKISWIKSSDNSIVNGVFTYLVGFISITVSGCQ